MRLDSLRIGARFRVPHTTLTGRVIRIGPGSVDVELEEAAHEAYEPDDDGVLQKITKAGRSRKASISRGTEVEAWRRSAGEEV